MAGAQSSGGERELDEVREENRIRSLWGFAGFYSDEMRSCRKILGGIEV